MLSVLFWLVLIFRSKLVIYILKINQQIFVVPQSLSLVQLFVTPWNYEKVKKKTHFVLYEYHNSLRDKSTKEKVIQVTQSICLWDRYSKNWKMLNCFLVDFFFIMVDLRQLWNHLRCIKLTKRISASELLWMKRHANRKWEREERGWIRMGNIVNSWFLKY